jgi:hypothetical protein
MIATEPAFAPVPPPPPPPRRAPRSAVETSLRWLGLAAGVATAAGAFVVAGFVALACGCVGDETTGICAEHAAIVPPLEWVVFLTAVISPLAGGVATFVRRQGRWVAGGAAVACAMTWLMFDLARTQSGLLG